MSNMPFEAAEARLLEVLRELVEQKNVQLFWWNLPEVGPRLAELGVVAADGMSGYSYMQDHQESGPILFACERFVLDLMHVPEDADISEDNLRRAFKGD